MRYALSLSIPMMLIFLASTAPASTPSGEQLYLTCMNEKTDPATQRRIPKASPETAIPACTQLIASIHSGTHDLSSVALGLNDKTSPHYASQLAAVLAATYVGRGKAYAALHDHARAMADFDQAIRTHPGYHFAGYWQRGRVHAEQKDYRRAIADYDQALALHPDHGSARLDRGIINLKVRRFQAAWSDYDAVLKICSKARAEAKEKGWTVRATGNGGAEPLYGRGIAALRLNRSAEGRADLARAAELNPAIAAEFAAQGIRP